MHLCATAAGGKTKAVPARAGCVVALGPFGLLVVSRRRGSKVGTRSAFGGQEPPERMRFGDSVMACTLQPATALQVSGWAVGSPTKAPARSLCILSLLAGLRFARAPGSGLRMSRGPSPGAAFVRSAVRHESTEGHVGLGHFPWQVL